jgi:nitrogen fixation/metabolism regulation signal transduction histidine kinase
MARPGAHPGREIPSAGSRAAQRRSNAAREPAEPSFDVLAPRADNPIRSALGRSRARPVAMNLTWIHAILAVALVVAAAIGLRGLAARSRLQRRLFAFFLALSWVPAIVVLLVSWQLEQRHPQLLHSPGLQSALESSLALARAVLAREQSRAQAFADSLAGVVSVAAPAVLTPPKSARLEDPENGRVLWSTGPVDLGLDDGGPGGLRPWLVVDGLPFLRARARVQREGHAYDLIVARPLDPVLTDRLQSAVEGISRFRQVGLVYSPLLRADALLSMAALTQVLLLASLLLARHLAARIGDPIRELARGTRRVAAGDLDHPVTARATDEVADLVDAFNRMTGDLKASKDDLVRSERIAAWQGIARRLAHEIKNPLTAIHLSIHRLRSRSSGDPTTIECLDTVLEETGHLQRLAEEFSLYARLPEPTKRAIALRPLLEQVVQLYARRTAVQVEWSKWPAQDRVWADEGQIRQVLANVIKNALEAMGPGGRLILRARPCEERLCVEIEDDGPGLPAAADRMFEPDFTTKPSGTGLGLAIARKILEDHGGTIVARAGDTGGSVFAIEVPRATEEAAS